VAIVMPTTAHAAKKKKSPRDSAVLTRKIVSPDLLNPNGTLFGGVVMSWIDEVAFMSARRFSGRPFVVTASIDNITFVMPLRMGDHVILTSQVNYVGRTSMEIGVKVEREDPYTGERRQATSAYLTFVALDKRGTPKSVPELSLETPEDKRRWDEARLRARVRERVRKHLKKKYAASPPMPPMTEEPVITDPVPQQPAARHRKGAVKAAQQIQKAIDLLPEALRVQVARIGRANLRT
jgi:acyl-CoA hydrolase